METDGFGVGSETPQWNCLVGRWICRSARSEEESRLEEKTDPRDLMKP